MSPDEIKAKAATLAELYAAVAAGRTLQHLWEYGEAKGWGAAGGFPCMDSDLSFWRVKPEPRRMWRQLDVNGEFTVAETFCEGIAISWKSAGHTVTEWQEVLP